MGKLGDFIKSDPNPEFKKLGNSHFINLNSNLPWAEFQLGLENSADENLYKTAIRIEQSFADKNISLDQQQQNLYFLIHILGMRINLCTSAEQKIRVGIRSK
ncbi:hypothetical protein KUH03_37355 [Sphingobacterium sp. E70]|uniref:hypothetical protein n=1 Tax=Sphingobacterium sp. E70 TaxID=2853439 RepID=UPI00211CD255|nr:hypothetical protein [Sphingobacterium sp. E70]ULT24557.1 hypothetical protein KUH03_37355 [Sphingobacterium sp. E70]